MDGPWKWAVNSKGELRNAGLATRMATKGGAGWEHRITVFQAVTQWFDGALNLEYC